MSAEATRRRALGLLALSLALAMTTWFSASAVVPQLRTEWSLSSMATWFRARRGLALGTIVGALTLGSALPHLVKGLGGLVARFGVADGPLPFPKAVFDPRQARLVFANRSVRLASSGYFSHIPVRWQP
jgi:hypothetical protein